MDPIINHSQRRVDRYLYRIVFWTVINFSNNFPGLYQKKKKETSYCSYARPAQPGPIRWLGPLR